MTIYLDMDGVIANFFGAIEKRFNVTHWKSIQNKEAAMAQLRNTDFFDTLPIFREDKDGNITTHGADLSSEIVNFVRKISNGDWGICTSPLKGDHNNSAYWKRRWLERTKFMPPLVENLIITSNKHKYAWNALTKKPNILVDDRPDNIRRWIDAGGIGIVFQTNEEDIDILFNKLEIAVERARTFELKDSI